MKLIKENINYWISRKFDINYNYIRKDVEGKNDFEWFVGYINDKGNVTKIHFDLLIKDVDELEKEYQEFVTPKCRVCGKEVKRKFYITHDMNSLQIDDYCPNCGNAMSFPIPNE